LLPYDVELWVRGSFAPTYGARVLLALMATVLIAVIRSWFVMVIAGLMVQTEGMLDDGTGLG